MTLDDVKKIAEESGWPQSLVAPIVLGKLAEFARAVAAHEREECARVCEDLALRSPENDSDRDALMAGAAAIRART